jgi:hypothetical protein
VAGSCEHGNEPSDSIKGGEFLDYLSVLFIRFSRTLLHRFVVYLTTLLVAQTLQRRMIGRVMNSELERIWKKLLCHNLR